MICKWIKVFYNNFEKSKVISWPIFVTLYLAPTTPNKKIKLTTENQEVNERTAEENNDNAEFEIHLSICVLLFFSVTYLNTSIFAMNKNSKSTHFGILNTKFGTLVFFYIVPVPFVPRDGTNGIFRDSGLSRRSLVWTYACFNWSKWILYWKFWFTIS